MTAENIRLIADAFAARVAGMERVPDPIGVLSEVTAALARDNAEFVFLKVQTEPGWTAETGRALADRLIQEHILSITDVLHANGGTLDMAQDLGKVAAEAYGARLAELAAGYGHGGAA